MCVYVCVYVQCECVHVRVLRMCAYAELCATCVCAVCVCVQKRERDKIITCFNCVYLYTAVCVCMCGGVDVYICDAETSISS